MTNIVSDRATMRSLAEAWDLIDLEAVKSEFIDFLFTFYLETDAILLDQSALVSNCAHELLTECFDR